MSQDLQPKTSAFYPAFFDSPAMAHYRFGIDVYATLEAYLLDVHIPECDVSPFTELEKPLYAAEDNQLLIFLKHALEPGILFTSEDDFFKSEPANWQTPDVALVLGAAGFAAIREIYARFGGPAEIVPQITATRKELHAEVPFPSNSAKSPLESGVLKYLQSTDRQARVQYEDGALQTASVGHVTLKREEKAFHIMAPKIANPQQYLAITTLLYVASQEAKFMYVQNDF